MFIKSAFRAPFYFFAGEGEGGGAGGAPVVVVTPAPAGTPGAAAAATGTLGTPPVETPPAAVVDTTPKKEGEGEKPPVKTGEVTPKPAAVKEGAKPAAEGGGKAAEETPLADWPADWREKMAGGDAKLLKRLERMSKPTDVLNAWRAIEVDMSSGKLAKKLPTHYTAEELADYKKSNGIPDKAEDYDTKIGGGIVWGETDKPHIDNFTKYALENNMTPEEVKKGLGWWAQYQEDLVGQQEEVDSNNAALAQNEMRALWAGNVNRNLTFVKNQFEGEKGAWAEFVNARGPDGRRLGDNATMMKFLFAKFQEADPHAVDLPGKGSGVADPAQRFQELNTLMKNKSSAYYRGPNRDQLQAEWRELYEVNERIKARKAG